MEPERFELAIVGAGPAGLSAAAHAQASGLRCVVLERAGHLADTIHCYQKRKLVMAEPALVPRLGELPFEAGAREAVLERWQDFVRARELDVRLDHEVIEVRRASGSSPETSGDFHLRTRSTAGEAPRELQAGRVILALGTQGNPRRLGVRGEDQPHVSLRLVDPDAHVGEDIVVVGAGDSALEVALALAERNRVRLIVRSAEILRAKESLERDVLRRQAAGEMTVHFSTTVERIGPDFVDLRGAEEDLRVAAQRVILKIGAEPPRKLLAGWGIAFAGEARDARPVLRPGFESSVPGLHLIGAVSGRDLIKLGINQGYEVVEHILGHDAEPADEQVLRERLPGWRGTVHQRLGTLRDAIPIFQGASEEQLREIFLLAHVLELADGEVIVRQNDYTDSLLVIAEGRVRISRRAGDGRQTRVAELEAGNFFGEMGLISGRRRNATAVADGPCRLIEIPRKAMLKLLHIAPAVQKALDLTFLVRSIQSYLFQQMADSSLWRLAGLSTLESLARDQVVFEEGDPSEALYLIRSGMVKLSRRSGEREIVLTYLTAGNYFGESALFADRPRTATVTAIFPTELIVLSRKSFQDFLDRHPHHRRELLAAFEQRQIASLRHEASPGTSEVLSQLIETEAVIGTDVLVIDNHKGVRCGNCIAACESVHDDGQARLSLTGNRLVNLLLPNSCMQCENPLCMLDCPPDAIVRRPGGEVFIRDTCIGCGNCAANCPYDNIFMVHPNGRRSPFDWLRRLLGASPKSVEQEVAVKCDLCRDLSGGAACVRSCPTGAAVRLEPESPEALRADIEKLIAPEDLA